ncbi:unnamed protein product [Calypogeia fissa]
MEGGWAPILHPVQLTGAGRPQLQQNEIECQLMDAVEMQVDSPSPSTPTLKGGVVTLTTHRIIWLNHQSKIAGAIPLAAVCKTFPPKKNLKSMFQTPRMRIQLWSSNGKVALGAANASEAAITLSFVFRGQSTPESFISRLGEVVEAKAWEADVKIRAPSQSSGHGEEQTSTSGRQVGQQLQQQQRPAVRKINPAMAGVSGILRKEQKQWEENDRNLHDAFQDLSTLMGKAQEMVSLAEKIRIKLLAGPAAQQSSVEDGEMGKQEIEDWLLSVGIISPVTKESAGALYHQQLARQLADFVKVPLQKSGGMLAMVDVYCLFNRARGTELISPEDLLQACAIWASLDVPVMMRHFDSGVMVIQSKNHTDEEVFARLEGLAKRPEAARQGISASDAARSLGIAPALAKEQLLAAENKGLLCRDDGEDGLRFFINFFVQPKPLWAQETEAKDECNCAVPTK